MEQQLSASYKLVYVRRHGPVVEHYGIKSGISRIWLEIQGQKLETRNLSFMQYATIIEVVIFVKEGVQEY